MENLKHFNLDGIEYFQLYIPCPVCLEKGWPTQPTYWLHGAIINGTECGGEMYVGENAFYYCKKCGRTEPVLNYGYSCPNHPKNGDNGEYIQVQNGRYILNAMTVASQICLTSTGRKFMRKFSAAFDDYCDEHGIK